MKIHWSPPPPLAPPAAPVKPPPTQSEIQSFTEELIAAAERERSERTKRVNAAKNRQRSGKDDGEEKPASKDKKLDVLA